MYMEHKTEKNNTLDNTLDNTPNNTEIALYHTVPFFYIFDEQIAIQYHDESLLSEFTIIKCNVYMLSLNEQDEVIIECYNDRLYKGKFGKKVIIPHVEFTCNYKVPNYIAGDISNWTYGSTFYSKLFAIYTAKRFSI